MFDLLDGMKIFFKFSIRNSMLGKRWKNLVNTGLAWLRPLEDLACFLASDRRLLRSKIIFIKRTTRLAMWLLRKTFDGWLCACVGWKASFCTHTFKVFIFRQTCRSSVTGLSQCFSNSASKDWKKFSILSQIVELAFSVLFHPKSTSRSSRSS